MPHPLHIGDLIVGGLLVVNGAFAYFWTRKRPERIRGLTYKQFAICCVVAVVCGALLLLWQFIFPR